MNKIFVLMLGLMLATTCRAQEETLTYGSSCYSLVKDESMLLDGDKVVLVGQNTSKTTKLAFGKQYTNNFGAVVAEKTDDNTLSLKNAPTVLTLSKNDNSWVLKYGNQYLYPGVYSASDSDRDKNANWLKTKSVYSDDCLVTISIDKDNEFFASAEFINTKRKSNILGFYTQGTKDGNFSCYAESSISNKHIWFYVQRSTNTLDEKDDNISDAIKAGVQNVSVKRAFHKGGWNTWCMPFDISLGRLKAVLGNTTEVSEFKSVKDGVMQFYPVTDVLKAGTPYLVKPENEV